MRKKGRQRKKRPVHSRRQKKFPPFEEVPPISFQYLAMRQVQNFQFKNFQKNVERRVKERPSGAEIAENSHLWMGAK